MKGLINLFGLSFMSPSRRLPTLGDFQERRHQLQSSDYSHLMVGNAHH
jgi:hypothetical protein